MELSGNRKKNSFSLYKTFLVQNTSQQPIIIHSPSETCNSRNCCRIDRYTNDPILPYGIGEIRVKCTIREHGNILKKLRIKINRVSQYIYVRGTIYKNKTCCLCEYAQGEDEDKFKKECSDWFEVNDCKKTSLIEKNSELTVNQLCTKVEHAVMSHSSKYAYESFIDRSHLLIQQAPKVNITSFHYGCATFCNITDTEKYLKSIQGSLSNKQTILIGANQLNQSFYKNDLEESTIIGFLVSKNSVQRELYSPCKRGGCSNRNKSFRCLNDKNKVVTQSCCLDKNAGWFDDGNSWQTGQSCKALTCEDIVDAYCFEYESLLNECTDHQGKTRKLTCNYWRHLNKYTGKYEFKD
ncbi:hypothetical protein N9N67_02115 [Bacteriovoracaceae bacterium]|nr:hypothetical protein [Bacteriovoracaceae bacterium]